MIRESAYYVRIESAQRRITMAAVRAKIIYLLKPCDIGSIYSYLKNGTQKEDRA